MLSSEKEYLLFICIKNVPKDIPVHLSFLLIYTLAYKHYLPHRHTYTNIHRHHSS